jgi:thiamine-phosphate pyrophosphorylase
MKIFVISNPLNIPGEHDLINALLEEGLEYFHLRKPEFSETEMTSFLKEIKPNFLKKISIHSHYKLIEKYNLKGIHLTNKYLEAVDKKELKDIFKLAAKRNLQLSTSIHNIEEIEDLKYNYVFLSPVFDSISKAYYKSSFNLEDLKEILKNTKSLEIYPEIIALGGIEENKIEKVIEMDFDGFALMGKIWNTFKDSKNIDKTIAIYKSAKLKCQTAGHTF